MALHHDLTMSLHRCLAVILVTYNKERSAHQNVLEQRGHLVLPARTLRTAQESIKLYSYDLLVLDGDVPQADRLRIVADATARNPGASILCVQAKDNAEVPYATAYIQQGDEAGFEFALDHFDHWQVPTLRVN